MVDPVNPSSWTALRELLREVLTEAELRELLYDLYGSRVVEVLPSTTPAEVFFAAVGVLERRGLVSEHLFLRLGELAPGKRARIAEVAAMWGLALRTMAAGPVIAALEGLHGLLGARETGAALAYVHERQGLFFPASDDSGAEGRTEYTVTVYPDDGLLSVERATSHRWKSTQFVRSTYALLGPDMTLLRGVDGGGWSLEQTVAARIEQLVAARRLDLRGTLHVFAGTRTQVFGHDRGAAWSAIKNSYAADGVLLRTTEGFIDVLASCALGERWFSLVPPESALARPL